MTKSIMSLLPRPASTEDFRLPAASQTGGSGWSWIQFWGEAGAEWIACCVVAALTGEAAKE